MHTDFPPLFGRRLPRFLAEDGQWRALCRPWFTKPAPRFFRSKSRIRPRRLPLRDGAAGA